MSSFVTSPSSLLFLLIFFVNVKKREKINYRNLKRNIKFLGETLSKVIFSLHGEDLDIFNSSLSIDERSLKSQLESLTSFPRVAPYMKKEGEVLKGLRRSLKRYTKDLTLREDTLSSKELKIAFYESSSPVSLQVFRTKSALFDLMMSILVAFYLFALYFAIKWMRGERTDQLIGNLLSLFSSSQKQKTR